MGTVGIVEKSRSCFGPPSVVLLLDWAHTSLLSPGLRPMARLQPKHHPPGSVALASGHHSPRLLYGLVDSLCLTHHRFYHQPCDVVYTAPVRLALSMVVFEDVCSWGSLKAFAADGLSLVLLATDFGFFGFSHCWVCFGFSVNAFFWSRVSCIFLL